MLSAFQKTLTHTHTRRRGDTPLLPKSIGYVPLLSVMTGAVPKANCNWIRMTENKRTAVGKAGELLGKQERNNKLIFPVDH